MQNNQKIKKFLSELNISDVLNIEEDLGNGYVKLKISEAERRQALQDINCVEDTIIELLRNSRDAKCKNIFIGTKKIAEEKRIIHYIDDGIGIPRKFHDVIFESRVTSKLEDGIKDFYGFHGRGMALFSIKLNLDEINVTYSDNFIGASFYLDINLNKIPEKKDQSLMPQIIKTDNGINIIGGVNNIIKTIIEFQLQNKDINFYYGSPTQILATMRNLASDGIDKIKKNPKFDSWEKFNDYINRNNVKIIEFPALTDNYILLEELSKRIFNMDISQRGIQRVIYNETQPLEPVDIKKLIIHENSSQNYEHKNINSKRQTEENKNLNKEEDLKLRLYDELKLTSRFKDDEIRCIIKLLENKIYELGRKYFIVPHDIELKKINNLLKITIKLKEEN